MCAGTVKIRMIGAATTLLNFCRRLILSRLIDFQIQSVTPQDFSWKPSQCCFHDITKTQHVNEEKEWLERSPNKLISGPVDLM